MRFHLNCRALIENLPRLERSKFVSTTTGKTPISVWSRAKQKLDELMLVRLASEQQPEDDDDRIELKPWRIDAANRRDWNGTSRHQATSCRSAAWPHSRQLHTYEEEKRAALEKSADHITALLAWFECAGMPTIAGVIFSKLCLASGPLPSGQRLASEASSRPTIF
jgi:hypothetical protein